MPAAQKYMKADKKVLGVALSFLALLSSTPVFAVTEAALDGDAPDRDEYLSVPVADDQPLIISGVGQARMTGLLAKLSESQRGLTDEEEVPVARWRSEIGVRPRTQTDPAAYARPPTN